MQIFDRRFSIRTFVLAESGSRCPSQTWRMRTVIDDTDAANDNEFQSAVIEPPSRA